MQQKESLKNSDLFEICWKFILVFPKFIPVRDLCAVSHNLWLISVKIQNNFHKLLEIYNIRNQNFFNIASQNFL